MKNNSTPVILVVDDTLTNMAFARAILQQKGFQVFLAKSGEDALALAKKEKPDLILLDIDMPGWNGYETCQHFKKEASLAPIPILFLSVFKNVEDKQRAFAAGGVDYISKPFQEEELLARVQSHIELYRLREKLADEIVQQDNEILTYANKTDVLEKQVQVQVAALNKAKKMAETAQLAKTQFIANMSHELRTPMNAIIGYNEMLLEDAEDLGVPEFLADLEKIHLEGKLMLGLINGVLDLSRIESGEMELHLETFQVEKLLNEFIATTKPLVEKKSNELKLNIINELGEMYADLSKTHQILFNLLTHAVTLTEDGHICIEVKREFAQEEGREKICFSISDDGIGMTPKQQERIFQPFTPVDANTMHRLNGTRLGLAITKHFIEMMGGTISVNSEFGRGSTFSVCLPALIITEKLTQKADIKDGRALNSEVHGIVLVIDDDIITRELLKSYLSKLGYAVAVAADGETGFKMAKKLRPDTILLDVKMPGMDGWKVLSALKNDSLLSDIPVIMTSILEEQNKGVALGAADYLVKPVKRAQLAAVLRKYHMTNDSQGLVMIVEDDIVTRENMAEMLKLEGWRVFKAENGRVALEFMEDKKPSLIILDLMMPEMDGFEFVTHLRQNEKWRSIPVVVLTATKLSAEDQAHLHSYVDSILQKASNQKEELLLQIHQQVAAAIPNNHFGV